MIKDLVLYSDNIERVISIKAYVQTNNGNWIRAYRLNKIQNEDNGVFYESDLRKAY